MRVVLLRSKHTHSDKRRVDEIEQQWTIAAADVLQWPIAQVSRQHHCKVAAPIKTLPTMASSTSSIFLRAISRNFRQRCIAKRSARQCAAVWKFCPRHSSSLDCASTATTTGNVRAAARVAATAAAVPHHHHHPLVEQWMCVTSGSCPVRICPPMCGIVFVCVSEYPIWTGSCQRSIQTVTSTCTIRCATICCTNWLTRYAIRITRTRSWGWP